LHMLENKCNLLSI